MKKLTAAQYRVLEYGLMDYDWHKVPGRREMKALPPFLRRSFGLSTLQALIKAGYIRYQPARYRLTGRGRKALKHQRPGKPGR